VGAHGGGGGQLDAVHCDFRARSKVARYAVVAVELKSAIATGPQRLSTSIAQSFGAPVQV
jgi:hypothetical protein